MTACDLHVHGRISLGLQKDTPQNLRVGISNCAMFKCTTCGKEKSDTDEGRVGRLAQFGVRLVSRPSPSQRLCKQCAIGASIAGFIVDVTVAGFVILAAAALVGLFYGF